MIHLLRYRREDGREPFTEWLNGLRDLKARARIRVRLNHHSLRMIFSENRFPLFGIMR